MMKFRRLYNAPTGKPEPADTSGAAAGASDPDAESKSIYAQSRKCRGCVYAGLLFQYHGGDRVYYCDYQRRAGHMRPIPAEACRGWDRNGAYRVADQQSKDL